jgi:hypothetical protein
VIRGGPVREDILEEVALMEMETQVGIEEGRQRWPKEGSQHRQKCR